MIRFESVTKLYKGSAKPALDSVSFEVLRGEFVFLVGPSGSGKSSVLRLILKEDVPTKGRILVLGQDLARIASRKVPYYRRNIGVVFQDFRLLPGKTVFQNVAFALQVLGKSRAFIDQAVTDVLRTVGLEGKGSRFPHELSGGEQQRVAIARAVVNKPAVLLADEPTGNLDPRTSEGIMTVLERINANGTTVIMATHDVEIVDRMNRRVIELDRGAVMRDEERGGYATQAISTQTQAEAATRPSATRPSATRPSASARALAPEPRGAEAQGAAPDSVASRSVTSDPAETRSAASRAVESRAAEPVTATSAEAAPIAQERPVTATLGEIATASGPASRSSEAFADTTPQGLRGRPAMPKLRTSGLVSPADDETTTKDGDR